MKIKPVSPKEIAESRFSVRTISIINDFLSERLGNDSPIEITFKEFCCAWEDHTDSYKTLIKNEFDNIGDLFKYYGWEVVDSDKGKLFYEKID
jgi:hypothetical protein